MKYILVLLLALPLVSALNVSGNISLALLPLNGTLAYAITYPGGNDTNTSDGPLALLYTAQIPIEGFSQNATLLPNASQVYSGVYDVLNVSCALGVNVSNCTNSTVYVSNCTNQTIFQNVTVANVTGFCNRTMYVQAGRTHNISENGCTINLISDYNYLSNESYSISAPITITQSGNVLTVQGPNDDRVFDMRNLNGSASFDLNYTCPIVPVNSESTAQEVLNYCSGMSPYYQQWFNNSLNKCLDQFNSYRDLGAQKSAGESAANQVIVELKATNANLSASLSGAQSQNMGLSQVIAQKDNELANYQIGMVVALVIIICLLVAIVAQWRSEE